MKTKKFFLWLAALSVAVGAAWAMTKGERNSGLHGILPICYSMTPLLAVVLATRQGVGRYFSRDFSRRDLWLSVAAVAVIFPLISFGLPLLCRGWLGIELLRDAGIFDLKFCLFLVLVLLTNVLVALLGEVAWRGFLWQNIQRHSALIIGVVWWAWRNLPIFMRQLPDASALLGKAVQLGFYVALSFLCVAMVQKTRTILAPAIAVGFIESSYYWLTVRYESNLNFLLGSNGLLAIVAVLATWVILRAVWQGTESDA